MSTQPTLPGFDYTALDPETRAIVQDTTQRLHELERRTGEAIIEIGRGLIDTKDRLNHGQFLDWLRNEFNWSARTAQRFMSVADSFGEMRHGVAFEAKALYLLASGSTPEEVREEFTAKAEAGERVTHQAVKQRLSTVNRDTGEIVDDDIPDAKEIAQETGEIHAESARKSSPTQTVTSEVVNPADYRSLLPDRPVTQHEAPIPMNPVSEQMVRNDIARHGPLEALDDILKCHQRLTAASRALREFPENRMVEHAGNGDAVKYLDLITSDAESLARYAASLRRQLAAGDRLRAVK